MTSLMDLVAPSSTRVDVGAASWRDAIREAGRLLTQAGVAGDSYTEAMIATVDEHGPYIVIAPGFAFAHARPDASVTRTGMSLIRLSRPVPFGHDSNDPVTLVLALAAVDADAHQDALAALAGALGDPVRRRRLEEATTGEELRAALGPVSAKARAEENPAEEDHVLEDRRAGATGATSVTSPRSSTGAEETTDRAIPADEETVPSKGFILTVCGNGVGTSLFLKNTLEGVLGTWGWSPYVRVEATDTISAKGRATEADVLLTSGAIAEALGDVGVPVEVVDDFTSSAQVDAALRRVYAV